MLYFCFSEYLIDNLKNLFRFKKPFYEDETLFSRKFFNNVKMQIKETASNFTQCLQKDYFKHCFFILC
jgi:hypothetical protein